MKLKPFLLSVLLAGQFCFGLMSDRMSMTMAQGKKAGQKSCDGVLDVVPAKALSFTRKRRPGKDTDATPAATENTQKTTRKKSR